MNPAQWPLWVSIGPFVASAVVVWFAGFRLACYADAIAGKTGLGEAALGMILLGGVTSLPELAVATTATLQGTPALSINDVLGSAAINVVILVLADAVIGRRAITSMMPTPSVMLQAVIGIVLMALAAAATLVGDRLVFGVGAWSWVMLATYLVSVRIVARSGAGEGWLPASSPDDAESGARDDSAAASELTSRGLAVRTLLAALAILGAGYLLARTGGAIAEQTGLGTSFFGAVVLGLTTSLPEVSTVLAALRLGRAEMAVSDLFGTNLFNINVIVLVDALHPGGPVLVEAGRFAGFGALLALVLTALYVGGMLERRERTVLRIGFDSVAVLAAYATGVAVLYGLR